jgi:thiol-disulfide isomerase/thioredoxin
MTWMALAVRLLLAAVFFAAAVGKLRDRRGAERALVEFGTPKRMAPSLAVALPAVEFATALLLIIPRTVWWGALASITLLAVFTGAIGVMLARGRRPNCHCFGQMHSSPVGWSMVVRNGCLATLAGFVIRGVPPDATVSVAGFASGTPLPALAWSALAGAGAALALALVEGWLLLNLLPQQGRLLKRIQSLEEALGRDPDGLNAGDAAPEFELATLDGGRRTLAALQSAGRPIVLVFTNPNCGPCDEVLPDVARWQREHQGRLTIAVISKGGVEANRAKAEKYGLRDVLLQADREVSEPYKVAGTPAAVLVSPGGIVGSRTAYMADGLDRLMRQATGNTADDPASPEPDAPQTPAIGEAAPEIVLPNLQGERLELASLRGRSTVVLFWSPRCGFCQHMLPQLKAWERKPAPRSPQLLVVSTGGLDENLAMGLKSHVVLDAEGSLMDRFGATGTPTAVLVDRDGRIASALAVGADHVMRLVRAAEPAGVHA